MVPVKPRTMPSGIGGDGGGTAAGQGKGKLQRRSRPQRRIRHVTEAASPRIGAAWVPNTPKADRVRPETGARCGKAVSRELRGGRLTTAVPTATVRGREFLQCKLASSPPFRSSQNSVLMARIRSKLSVILSLGGGVMMGLLYEQSRIILVAFASVETLPVFVLARRHQSNVRERSCRQELSMSDTWSMTLRRRLRGTPRT
jgi:hypothetical protein